MQEDHSSRHKGDDILLSHLSFVAVQTKRYLKKCKIILYFWKFYYNWICREHEKNPSDVALHKYSVKPAKFDQLIE